MGNVVFAPGWIRDTECSVAGHVAYEVRGPRLHAVRNTIAPSRYTGFPAPGTALVCMKRPRMAAVSVGGRGGVVRA